MIEKVNWSEENEKRRKDIVSAEKVVIIGIYIIIADLVAFMVKVSIVAIPAAIVVAAIWSATISF